MKRFAVRCILVILLGLLFVSPVFADGITLSGPYPGGYGWYTASSGTAYPVSPYLATITIGSKTETGYLACLDLFNTTQVGAPYSGTFHDAGTDADKEVSWLMDHLVGKTPNSDLTVVGPISMAIWKLEFGTSTNIEGGLAVPMDSASQAWFDQAVAAVATGGYVPDHLFFTPDNNASQRYGLISTTPEPGTLLTMGSGIILLGNMVRRKFLP